MVQKLLIVSIGYERGIYSIKQDFPKVAQDLLKESEFKYAIFKQSSLANIDELVEEIIAEQYTSILFFAEPIGYRLVQILANKIYEVSSEYKIFLYENKRNAKHIIDNFILINNGGSFSQLTNASMLSQQEGKINTSACANNKSGLETPEVFQVMSNGYIAYITGFYPESVVGFYSKHIGWEEFEDDYNIYSLGEYLNVNSAIIHSRDRYSIEAYNDRLHKALGENVFVSHYHQKVIESGYSRIYMDDLDQYLNTIECSYNEFYKLENDKKVDRDALYTLSINCIEDLEAFLKDVTLYELEGVIRHPNFILKDECRWQMKCNLKYLPRMNVTAEGDIKPCLCCDKVIGTTKDSYYVNIRKAAKCIDHEYLKRECRECNLKSICSKCSMLPTFLNAESYCYTRKKNPLIVDFLEKKNIYYYLFRFSNTVTRKNLEEVKFSNANYTVLFPNKESNSYNTSKKVYLMYINYKPLLFNFEQNSLFEIDEYLAFILEGYLKNYDEKEIGHYLSEKYKLDSEESCGIVNNGFELLKNAGIIR